MADFTVKGDTSLDTSGAQTGFSKMGSLAKKGFLIAGVAAAAATIKIVSSAVTAYASYEQLVGGVDTLFKESSDKVQAYAENAYKTSGLSANAYMETVTGFSASLLQSLDGDTEAAADKADMAITDMSDNANKMGTSMDVITQTYQGFAKQNYTMLDNLKLGYGGTKTEMQRLLSDASAISGIEYDISSYADVVDALHVIQTEMGITGTTALEAEETISGSLNMLKGAYANFLVGLGNPDADLQELTDNMIDSLQIFLGNLMPVIENILASLIDVMPQLVEIGIELIASLIDGIVQSLPELIPAMIDGVLLIIQTLVDNLPLLIDAGIQLLMALAEGLIGAIPLIVEQIPMIVNAIVASLDTLIPLMVDIGVALFTAIIENLPAILKAIVKAIPQIIIAIVDAFNPHLGTMMKMGVDLFVSLVKNMPEAIKTIVGKIPELIDGIVEAFSGLWEKMKNIGSNITDGIWEGLTGGWDWLVEKIGKLADKLPKAVKKILGIASPSKVFAWIGEMSAEGMAVGFENNNPLDQITKSLQTGMANITAQAAISQDINLNSMIDSNSGVGSSYVQNVNVYHPISDSPSDLAKTLRRSTEKYGLAGAF